MILSLISAVVFLHLGNKANVDIRSPVLSSETEVERSDSEDDDENSVKEDDAGKLITFFVIKSSIC